VSARTAALLIDDDARLASLVTEYLGQHGIDVTVAGDARRGLASLRGRRFDVVLLDVMLPGIDGFEACRRIRATPDLAGLPIVMLTARGDDVDKVVGLELGADDYLAKPFNPRDGPGIPPAERAQVFVPFYRGDRARTPDGARGVGLGLTLARRVAEVHGGSIAVEAAATVNGHERGCRVVITLPADPATA
jgi:CheY-like chemotaxis protein